MKNQLFYLKKSVVTTLIITVVFLSVAAMSTGFNGSEPATDELLKGLPATSDKVKNLSEKQLTEITPAEFSEITGKKLTFKEKLALKMVQKKIKKSLNHPQKAKSQVLALILVLLVGVLGIHRFYLGYTWQGVVQLLTLGGCGIWALIDLIRIIMGTLKPADGSNYDPEL
jgi:hypothetical protein